MNTDFESGANRYRVAKQCPCGKSNRDGKFSPLKGYTDKGKCHSCNKFFAPENEKKKRIELPLNCVGLACNFRKALYTMFKQSAVDSVLNAYKIGNYNGNTMFPYIDRNEQVRSAKLIKYNGLKRDKDKHPYWLHSGIENFYFERCLFGEHLIEGKKVNVVESEKSAIIGKLARGGNWVATGGKSNISMIMNMHYDFQLYPDNDGIEEWEKYGNISFAYKAAIADKPKGYDFADMILDLQSPTAETIDEWDKEINEIRNIINNANTH
jgi:hypothetical protein